MKPVLQFIPATSENTSTRETPALQVHRRFVSASAEQNAELNEMVDLCNSRGAALDPYSYGFTQWSESLVILFPHRPHQVIAFCSPHNPILRLKAPIRYTNRGSFESLWFLGLLASSIE